jgi:hypothetical protein
MPREGIFRGGNESSDHDRKKAAQLCTFPEQLPIAKM